MRIGPYTLEIRFARKKNKGRKKSITKKRSRAKRSRQGYKSWPVWQHIKTYYGFKSFYQGWQYVVLEELVQKLNEISLLHQIETQAPDYII